MSASSDPPPGDESKTVFIPGQSDVSRFPPAAPAPPPPTAWPPARTAPPTATTAPPTVPPIAPGRVDVGAILNGIYQIRRFMARGGMGEVFEGVNINDDHDRVAIKVILPSLAADPSVRAMFLKEARTLTRLAHPALVRYRVMAQEPTLGVFYIVTEFIDGEQLSEVLGRFKPTSADLRALIRRLAEGLRSAHALDAVHRDVSPDNIMLPGGNLAQATIIDFGIAKDLDPGKATIVGDGFAGKLGYVAPEQFGDFGRQIGPWTDVYSLGLVVLSFAAGRNVDMGATLVDAVDRRRAGPDLSPIPEDLRPLLAAMLAPDPARRLRSMDEVLQRLDGAPPAAAALAPPLKAREAKTQAEGTDGGPKALPLILGGVAALAVIGGAVFLLTQKKPAPAPPAAGPAAGGEATITRAESARRAIEAALPTIGCAWLDLVTVAPQGSGVAISVTGVARSPQDAYAAVRHAAQGAGVTDADVNSTVLPVDPNICAALDAFRPVRADTSATGRHLSTTQAVYTLEKQASGAHSENIVIDLPIGDASKDLSLYSIEPDGAIKRQLPDRSALIDYITHRKAQGQSDAVADTVHDSYQLPVTLTPPAGMYGYLLLTGKGPFDTDLITRRPADRGPDWASQVAQAGQAAGWKAEMVWFKTVDPPN
jgi:serine/threonine-protein kinase